MTIVEALKSAHYYDVRVTHDWRWLCWDDVDNEWVVREKKPYVRNSKVLVKTGEEEFAVNILMKEGA